MDKSKIIIKIACLIGYLLFAGFSAYFTASSLSLNLLNGTNLWIVFAMVYIVAVLAGWCLTNTIKELNEPVRASRSRFLLNLIGFLLLWAFSFMTNVHYFFVEKHGYSILAKELSSEKNYIVDNTTKSNNKIEDDKNIAQAAISAQVHANIEAFQRELHNTMEGHQGFSDACINILNSTETALVKDSKIYGDQNEYVIFDDTRDSGDRGITQRNRFPELQTKYTARMVEQLNKKLSVIDSHFERKKNQNAELSDILEPIGELESKHLPAVEKDGTVNAFYKYYTIQDSRVTSKMPDDYDKKRIVTDGDNIKEFTVYPSKRMFDTMSVWGDITSGRLKGMTMIQWIIIALLFDIVAFILFALFRKQN